MRLPSEPTSRRSTAATLAAFWRDPGGATAVEYGLMVACIAVALLGVLGLVGTNISATLNRINSTLSKT